MLGEETWVYLGENIRENEKFIDDILCSIAQQEIRISICFIEGEQLHDASLIQNATYQQYHKGLERRGIQPFSLSLNLKPCLSLRYQQSPVRSNVSLHVSFPAWNMPVSTSTHPRTKDPSSFPRPNFLFNLHQQQSRRSLPLRIKQIHEAITLLQAIQPDARPRRQIVACVASVFDFEPVSAS